jgi:hypothetical protein
LLDVNAFGGAAEVEGISDGDEVSKVAQLHAKERSI